MEEFVYLGSLIHSTTQSSPDIPRRNEHLYSPKQAARQTEDRLYTYGNEVLYILAYKSQNLQQNRAPKVGGRLIRG